ncbi:lactonase family protein [Aestuariivivens sediminicola]|uniref:lactonase family protein n=1 Tax=Aestuariivivens sediminicola TaxID=2913560 RepID=UPI001F5786F6|nr:lactonase family protein [Aestuariivivens sediminicola]
MRIWPFLIFLISFFYLSCDDKTTPLYVGTYTQGESEGIYSFEFNTKTGELTHNYLVAKTDNPSFLTFAPNRKFLFAVNEGETPTVSSFKVEDSELSFLSKVSSHGNSPCHIALNETGDKAVVSNYGGGNFALFSIKDNGEIDEAFQVVEHQTDSISSHVHSAEFIEDHLYVADLGKNAVYDYELRNRKYVLRDSSIVNMAPNSGPRHFTFTNDNNFIYIINELSSTITTAKRTDEGFKFIETVSTLSKDFKGDSFCADIHLSKDEKFIYGSNRGENSIVVFKRNNNDGTLEKIQNISVHGDWPRNFTIDPSGNFLLVANQRSHNITVFKIDKYNGRLTFLHEVEVPSPACLLF